MNTSTLSIIINAVDRGARVAIKGIGDEVKKLGTEGSTAVAGMRARLGELDQSGQVTLSTFTSLAAVTFAGAVAGLAALSSGMVIAVKHASDLNETTNKFDTVFAGMTGQAGVWAQELQSSYGMSKNASMDMLASLQVLNQGMGMSQGEAGKLSNEMIKLAVDLGSFNNLKTTDVLNAMRSALVGEYDPIQRFAGAINAAAVEQKVLAMHLAKTKDEITAADKAQAMYQLVLESNTKAVGDFIKTTDGLANQNKIFQSNIEDLSAAFGTRLLPVAADVLKKINAGITDGKGGVDGLSETISVKLLQALGTAVETMRFFHNGWLGIKLVGTLAIDAIAQGLSFLFTGMRQFLFALDMAADGLVKLGALEVNPFDNIERGLGTFASSSRDVTGQVMADIESTNAGYDTIKSTINGYIDMVKTTGPATATASATAVAANTAVAASSQKVLDAQSKLHDKLAKDMAKNAEEQVRLVVWADGVTRETITSQYDRKLTLLNMEYEAAKKTAGGNITLLQEVETWHQASIARIQSYDEQYSKADQKRLEGMKDTFMVAEEQKVEATNQTFVASQKAYESMTAFVTSSKQTEVEIWREASDKQIAELEKLSDGTQEYTDALNDYKATKDREYFAKLKKQTKENLTEMDKLWQAFGHDVYNNFESVLASGLKREFDSIGDATKALTDRIYSDFLDLIAKLIVAWAKAKIISWWTGNESTFSFSASGGGSGGGSSSAGGTVGGLATTAATSLAKDYIWTNGVKPLATTAYEGASSYLFGSGAAGATGAAATSGGSIASGTATPAIMDAYAAYGTTTAATTSTGAAAGTGAATGVAAGETSGAAAAGTGAAAGMSTAVVAGYAAIIAAFALSMTFRERASMSDRLNATGMSASGLAENTGILDNGKLQAATEDFKALNEQFGQFSQVSVDSSAGLVVLGSEIREVNERGQETTTGMSYLVETFNASTGTWENTKINFQDLIAQMDGFAPVTAEAIDSTAAYVAQMAGIPDLADELAIAYAQAALGTDAFAQSVALAGGAFVNAAGVVMSGVDMVNAAAAGLNTSGYVSSEWAAEGHNFANNQDAISTPATDASFYELNGRAEGGIVDRLLIPKGDDGIGALSLGEGVLDKDTMKILSAAIRSGKFSGESTGSDEDIMAILWSIASATKKTAALLGRFEYTGIPQSTREAVA